MSSLGGIGHTLLWVIIIIIFIIVVFVLLKFLFQVFMIGPAVFEDVTYIRDLGSSLNIVRQF